MKNIAQNIGKAFFFFLFAFMVYFILIAFPLTLVNNAECLRLGYPKASITIGLERYCMDNFVAVPIQEARRKDK